VSLLSAEEDVVVKARTTISDVAREAGVSKGLVSFALNDRPGVAAETRERILKVADALGWVPSMRARALSSDRAFALGLVIARDPAIIAGDPFFPAFISGLEQVLAPIGQSLVLSMVADEVAERATYRRLVENGRVDGVVLTDLRNRDSRLELITELGLDAVTLGFPDVDSPFGVVSLDDGPGIRSIVAHLADLGHSRIAHVAGASTMLHGKRRRDSFAAALRERGLDDTIIAETDFSAPDGARATSELLALDEPPTAIVYANDPMAVAGLGVAHRAGLRVPVDLSITGFDGSDVAEYMYPSLTTVTTSVTEWGRAAATLLLTSISGGDVIDVDLEPGRLVIRESTAPPLKFERHRSRTDERNTP
jgi:DNA-binding LacI/PurR family transcriptional regulator